MRRARLPLRVAATAAVLAVLLGGAAILRAAGGAQTASRLPSLSAGAGGDLSISDSKEGAAIFQVSDLGPGGTGEGGVIVANAGTVRGALTLSALEPTDAPGLYGGVLSRRIQLSVIDLREGAVDYSGALDAMPSLDLGVLEPGETEAYRFVVEMLDGGPPPSPYLGDNLYQRASTSLGYRWTLTEVEPGAPEVEERPNQPSVEPPPERPRRPRPPKTPQPPRTRVGTSRPDALLGDSQPNTLLGRAGSDMILGMGGNDRLLGGRGADWLDPGRGRDHVRGGPGADLIHARDGEPDTIDCGEGQDTAYVDGRDRVYRCESVTR